MIKNKVCLLVLDGVGINPNPNDPGDAVRLADMKNYETIKRESVSVQAKASGPEVGLVSPKDAGNSEVGHNAIGAGQHIKQGLALIDGLIESGGLFKNETWKAVCANAAGRKLHFIGLLSHGRIHSDIAHLFALLRRAAADGVKDIFVHCIIDGRDVPPQSARENLKELLDFIAANKIPAKIADVGGREKIMMDRYFSRPEVVKKCFDVYFRGDAPHCDDVFAALKKEYKANPLFIDENFEPVILDKDGKIENGDSIVVFNYRGDRAIELADMIDNFATVPEIKKYCDKCCFAAMTQYEPDLKIPRNFLAQPPQITNTLTEHLCKFGVRQLAVAETQKFGHLTYYFNGNRQGKIDPNLEEYVCVPSQTKLFSDQPEMRAREICDAALKALDDGSADFIRANFANGDMVGHSGMLEPTIAACRVVDECLGKIWAKCKEKNVSLITVGDHGNAEEKFDAKGGRATKHTANKVWLTVKDFRTAREQSDGEFGLTNIAATVCRLLDIDPHPAFNQSVIK